MANKLKFFILSSLVAVSFSMSQATQSMDDTPKLDESQKPSEMQLSNSTVKVPLSPIILIQHDGVKKRIKVNLDQPLSELRSTLVSQGKITSDDIFHVEGSEIHQDDEKDWIIKEVIKDNTLYLKPKKSPSSLIFGDIMSPANKPNAAKYQQSEKPEMDIKPLSDVDESLKFVKSLNDDTAVVEDSNTFDYNSLSQQQWEEIFRFLKLKNGVNLMASNLSDANYEVEIKTSSRTVTWDKPPNLSRPEHDLAEDKTYSLSKMHHELRKLGITNVTKNGGYLGIGVDTECNFKREALNRNQKVEIYLLAIYNVAKLELSIPKEFIKPSVELEKEIEDVAKDQSQDSYIKLIEIFNESGFCVPTQFILGGQIYCEERTVVSSKEEAVDAEKKFAASVEASFHLETFSGGGGHKSLELEQSRYSMVSYRVIKQVRGGHSDLSNDFKRWRYSLKDPKLWTIIKKDGFIPLIEILSPPVRDQCRGLIKAYYKGLMTSNEFSLAALRQAIFPRMPLLEAWLIDARQTWLESVFSGSKKPLINLKSILRATKTMNKLIKDGTLLQPLHWYDLDRIKLTGLSYGGGSSVSVCINTIEDYRQIINEYIRPLKFIPHILHEMEQYQQILHHPHPYQEEYGVLWKELQNS